MKYKNMKTTILTVEKDIEPAFFSFNCYASTWSKNGYYTDYWHRINSDEMYVSRELNTERADIFDEVKTVISINKSALGVSTSQIIEAKLFFQGLYNLTKKIKIGEEIYSIHAMGETVIDITSQYEQNGSMCDVEIYPVDDGETPFKVNRIELTYFATEPTTVKSLYIKQQPDKTTYLVNTRFDPAGMIVIADFGNGITSIVTDYNYDKSPLKLGDNYIVIEYQGVKTELWIKVVSIFDAMEHTVGKSFILDNPKWNLTTQDFRLLYSDVSIGDNSYEIAVSHLYDSQNNEAFQQLYSAYGKNWKLDIDVRILHQTDAKGVEQFKMVDNQGNVSRFILFDTGLKRYYNEDDPGTVLIVRGEESAYVEVVDEHNNKMVFNKAGYLKSTISCLNNSIKKVFEYESYSSDLNNPLRLSKVYDERKPASYLKFTYSYGKLNKIIVVKDNQYRKGFIYDYGGSPYLLSITQQSYNSSNASNHSKKIAQFIYSDSKLILFKNIETKDAIKFTYNSSGHAKRISSGIYTDYKNQVQDLVDEYGFIEKKYNEFLAKHTYYSVYQTDVINERGVKTALQMDSQGKIVSTFEFEEKYSTLLTLEDPVGVPVDIKGTDTNNLINGEKALRVPSGTFTLPDFNVYKNYTKNYKNYTCSFYVKLQYKQSARVRAILKYGDQNNYVYIDETAVHAWQKVTLPIRFQKESEMKNVKGVQLIFLDENGKYVDVSVASVYFNGGDADTFYLAEGIKFDDLTEWNLNFVNKSSKTRALNNAKGFLTRSDLLRAYTNPLKVANGSYDIIYNDGKKRVANVASATVVTAKKEVTFLPSLPVHYVQCPDITCTEFYNERRAPDNMSWTRQYFRPYWYSGNTYLLMQQEVRTFANGIKGKASSTERTSRKSVWLDQFQRTLQERDAYGIDTVYTYYPNSGPYYGRLKKVEQVSAPDTSGARTRLTLSENKYTEEGEYLIASTDGITTNSYTHYKPFTFLTSSTETEASKFSGITSSNYENGDFAGIKTKYIYDEYIDYLLSVVATGGTDNLSNTMTYENGRLRTVTDGTQKFGVRQDLIDDTAEYTVFSGNDEITMQKKKVTPFDFDTKISTVIESYLNKFDDNKGTAAGHTILELDKYGRAKVHSYYDAYDVCDGSAKYNYVRNDASPSSQKIDYIKDDYSNSFISYNYDTVNKELVGWDLKYNTTADNDVSILQIGSGQTKYSFGPANKEKYKTVIEYDTDVTISPRIKSTHVFGDHDADKVDNWTESLNFSRNYEYDNQGRIKTIGCNWWHTDSFEYVDKLNSRAFLVKTHRCSARHCDYNEDFTYDDMGNLKTHNTSWTKTHPALQLPSNESFIYEYDKFNRLSKVKKGSSVTEYQYQKTTGRLLTISGGYFPATFNYFDSGRDKGRLKTYGSGLLNCSFTYDNYGNRSSITTNFPTKPSATFNYERGNLLSRIEFSSGADAGKYAEYGYNYAGMRYVKCLPDGTVIRYLLDGPKILGENRSNGVKLRYFYDATGIIGFTYTKNNVTRHFTYLKDALGNVIGIENSEGTLLGVYSYDERGNYTVHVVYETDYTWDALTINPFRWKGFYYDEETGYYNISSRYYDPETATFLNVVTPEEMLSAACSIGGLNRDAITFGNFIDITPNGFDITTMDDLAADMSYNPDANKSWWELHINSIFATVQILFGVLACLLGMELIGIALIGMGIFGLLPPGAQQVLNGLGTITTGVTTVITGISLFAAGPVGWVLGTICLVVGVAAIAIGVNEFISGAVGVNYLREWTGMSEASYYALYVGINIACTVCTIVGQSYKSFYDRKLSGNCVGNRCFIAGTLVLTAEGYKKIEDIQVGDLVLAYDEDTGEQAYKPVVQLFRNETYEWYHVHVNGEEIVCTAEHPFFVVDKGFIPASSLKTSDILLQSDGTEVIIEAIEIEKLSTPEKTYNFEVEDYHTYYVTESKILTHNVCREEAMRQAKEYLGIAEDAVPDSYEYVQIKQGVRGKPYTAKVYKFGDKWIRDDMGGHRFWDKIAKRWSGHQPSHFNVGIGSIEHGQIRGVHFYYG